MVRAKLILDGYETTMTQHPTKRLSDGSLNWRNDVEMVEKRTLYFSPVYASNDPKH